ncbi:hypothetical protein T10_8007 [Trichinella papuae]|uniref:Uncharacterized protein n=1 Tax=Trichinella papuae TaxID=268474 RepID=A0A0V1M2C7_9BILA|nr:hypothetical protein T10_931 [Trichinella papuae]KRZ65875.1 hypothetical protein T10_8007 [Trichinella papuae]
MKPKGGKTGSLSWQKIESMVCFHMAVKDQCAASDRTQGNPECPELPGTQTPKHLTLAYPALTQPFTINVFIRLIASSTLAIVCSKGRSTQGHMLNWGSDGCSRKSCRKKENEEAFKKFDHMLAFDHVKYQMCVPWTSAKTETSMTSTRRHYAVSR